MTDTLIRVIELELSPIPDKTIMNLNEKTLKAFGCIWEIHKNDEDPFPSNPHAHNKETGLKMDLSTGELYYKRKSTGKKVEKKKLLRIRDILTDIHLPELRI